MPTAEPAPKPKKTWVISGTLFQKEFGKKPSKTIWKGKAYEGPAFKAFIEGKREIPAAQRSLADRILGRGREPGTVKLGHEITQLDVGGAFRSRAPFKLYKELDTRIGPFANEVKVMDAIDKFMGSGGDESRKDKQTGEPLNKRQIVMHNMLSAAGVEDADAIVSKIKFETGQDSTVWTSEKFVNKLLDIRRKHYRGWVPLGRLMYEHRGEMGKTINEVVNDAIGDGTLHIDRYPAGGLGEGGVRAPTTQRPGPRRQMPPREGRHDALERLMERQGKRAGDLSGFFERMDREGMPRRARGPVGEIHMGMRREGLPIREGGRVTIGPKLLRKPPIPPAAVDDWRRRGSGSRFGGKGKPKYFYPPEELGAGGPTEELLPHAERMKRIPPQTTQTTKKKPAGKPFDWNEYAKWRYKQGMIRGKAGLVMSPTEMGKRVKTKEPAFDWEGYAKFRYKKGMIRGIAVPRRETAKRGKKK